MRQSYVTWVTTHYGASAARRYERILGTTRRYRKSLDQLLTELSRKSIAREIHAKAGF